MRVTIFGATGLLGQPLMKVWDHHEVHGFGSKQADIRDPRQIREAIGSTRPDWIVLAAAYTDVDGCETNQELAQAVNTGGADPRGRGREAVGRAPAVCKHGLRF